MTHIDPSYIKIVADLFDSSQLSEEKCDMEDN